MSQAPPPIDAWTPLPLSDVVAAFSGAPFRWWISGGVALELYLGQQWRSHSDIDVGILRRDAPLVHRWLAEWDMWVAAHGRLEPWVVPTLSAGSGLNNVWIRRTTESAWEIDLTVGNGDSHEWISRRDEAIRRTWDEAVLETPDGVPYLAPDIQLLFKSKNTRPKDDVDATMVIPHLSHDGLLFLDSYLAPDHQWRPMLTRR